MNQKSAPYIFIAPAILFFVCISIIPMVYAFGLAFFREEYGSFFFNGIDNFIKLIQDSAFRQAVFNTLLYAIITIPAGLCTALFFAVLLHSGIKGKSFFRAIYFTPAVTTTAAIGYIWLWLYDPYKGVINHIITSGGLDMVPFLTNTNTALISIAVVRIWTFLGFQTVIFLAGLQAIPDHYYEASSLEGANSWQRFRYITLPLLNPTILFLAVIGTIKTLQMFTEIYVMTENGGPLGSTQTIVYLIQQTAFSSYQKGYAAAMTVVLFVLILILTLIQFKFVSKRVEY